ncbi:dihydrolipoamide acetyltransferase family protein [Parafrigoribacterium mesophilum]|uniref:dihydrolipoamide acetyltransferase family protein n=1 Tax=Parafrigoribacterium mesophilum TaxID=433646 RepID=UPI0031FC8FC5
MTTAEFALPDAGEGLTEAEIVSWRVAVGESVDVNQVLVEIETAKSLVELPSPFAGVVTAILVPEGQTVAVGTPIIAVETAGPVAGAVDGVVDPAEKAPEGDAVADTAGSISSETDDTTPEGSGAVLVGYGSRGPARSRRRTRTTPVPERVIAGSAVLAKPPVRKLAKDLDVDLAAVTPTGPVGEVTRDDVMRQASQVSVFRNLQTPDWSNEREERIPVKGVRKAIASAMVSSAFSAPHVSLFVDVDATRTMEFVARLKASADFAGIKVSPLLIMAKAMIWAVRRNPTVNAQWTDREIIVKHYVNLGIAAATPRGLIVPNVKEAHSLSLVDLASALEQLTITAREGKTSPADTAGGTITITNIGVFGMDTGTPILNPGEVGIVALGTIKKKPWVVDGEVRPRFVTTLGASFDHRVVDGDVASRFLADVASIIEEPALLLD